MKRYRIINIDFDARANLLGIKIEDWWESHVKQLHKENQENIRQGLLQDFGSTAARDKLKNFIDLGAAPFSILAYHNRFLRQIRHAFVIGGYYPALTGACVLGERILNHLLLSHRDFFKSSPEYKDVYRKDSFDDWSIPINTLQAWAILLPDAVAAFDELKIIRNNAIHFRPDTDHNDRSLALSAIHTLCKAIEAQFSAIGSHPWFIPNTPGTAFLKKAAENEPFIRTVYIPNCSLVGPYHSLEYSGNRWIPRDDFPYDIKEVTDEEFANLYNNKASRPSA